MPTANNIITIDKNRDIEYSGFKLHKLGVTPIGSPTFEQWQEAGEFIKKANGAVHFWIGDWLNYGEQKWGETYSQAIDHLGYDYQTLANDKWIASKIPFSLRGENLSQAHAKVIASLEPDDMRTFAQTLKEVPMTVNELRQEVKKAKKLKLGTPTIPEGEYSVIYADPPWDIGSFVLDKWESPLEDKYPTMTEEELKAMKLPQMAEDCVCFMWTTLSTLQEALRLLEFWGFKYHITITWDKGNGWSMSGFHRKTELCLVGYKGILSNVVKQEGEFIPTVFSEAKRAHSQKPETMYKFIEERTTGNKVELFARNKREGWASFGNQL